MKQISFALVPFLGLLAACGDAAGSMAGLPRAAAELAAPAAAATLSAAPSDTSAALLYVANRGNNSITVYRDDAAGDTAPLRTISGPRTGLSDPGQITQDAHGNLYVANGVYPPYGASTGAGAILVFARGANGDVAPLRVLAGPRTGIQRPQAVTVDQRTGQIFVLSYSGPSSLGASTLLRFAADANGDRAPSARSTPTLSPAFELSSDSTGDNLIEAHNFPCCNSFNAGIDTLPKAFANGARVARSFGVDAFAAHGVVDDPTTQTYLATNNGIYRFAETTTGHGSENGPATFRPAPLAVIISDACGSQLALGNRRDIYVTHSSAWSGCSTDAIYVYPHDAAGNVPPLRVLSGPATGLNAPYGIYAGE